MRGNAAAIPPAPSGYYGAPGPEGGPGSVGYGQGRTGKIESLIYDSFGDFEGFVLHTEDGQHRSFCSDEPGVEALVSRAWEARIVLTVFNRRHHPEQVQRIVFRRAPHDYR
jgi:hypothetical protein